MVTAGTTAPPAGIAKNTGVFQIETAPLNAPQRCEPASLGRLEILSPLGKPAKLRDS